jgi:hypothetical protein
MFGEQTFGRELVMLSVSMISRKAGVGYKCVENE